MNRIILAFTLVCAVGSVFGCNIPVNHADPFYSAWVDWDSPRFPLIKPYEVDYVGGDVGWTIPLHSLHPSSELRDFLSIYNVEKISVADGVIMVYASYELATGNGNTNDLSWFVIIPDQEIETGFVTEPEFLEYLEDYDIDDLVWENPEDVNRRFLDTGCLKWIPEC